MKAAVRQEADILRVEAAQELGQEKTKQTEKEEDMSKPEEKEKSSVISPQEWRNWSQVAPSW